MSKFIILMSLVSLLFACNTTRPYHNTKGINVDLIVNNTNSTFLNRINISIDIYSLSRRCEKHYEGTLKLNPGRNPISLPPNKYAFLVFEFNTRALLRSEKNKIRTARYLLVKRPYRYKVHLSYKKSIYNIEIYKMKAHVSTKIKSVHPAYCK